MSCGDPRFTGSDGKEDQDFCILSDANLHIDDFIGKRNPAMSRDWPSAPGKAGVAAQIQTGEAAGGSGAHQGWQASGVGMAGAAA